MLLKEYEQTMETVMSKYRSHAVRPLHRPLLSPCTHA